MLSNPFYYGAFEYPEGSGNWYEGKHEKAITQDEFELSQNYRGHKNRPRPQKHLFPYTGMMKCGECGCSIIVDPKVKVQKNGNVHEYHYYRCTKSKGHCSQKYLEVGKLETQLKILLESIKIPNSFHEWALYELQQDSQKEIDDRNEILGIAQKGYDETVCQIDDLVKKYISKKIPEHAYDTNLKDFTKQKRKYKKILDNTDERIIEWTKQAKKSFKFAYEAKQKFEDGDLPTKNTILLNLGANIVIKDLQLSVKIDKPLIIIKKKEPLFNRAMKSFEPLKSTTSKEEMLVLMSKSPIMGGQWGLNPRPSDHLLLFHFVRIENNISLIID
ncbi:MAG: zinc ribbon domain-containing protein [bacterium]